MSHASSISWSILRTLGVISTISRPLVVYLPSGIKFAEQEHPFWLTAAADGTATFPSAASVHDATHDRPDTHSTATFAADHPTTAQMQVGIKFAASQPHIATPTIAAMLASERT